MIFGKIYSSYMYVWLQIGTVSFGLGLGCELGWPTVHTRITNFVDWIAANSDVVIQP